MAAKQRLWMFLVLFSLAEAAVACRYSGTSPIELNGFMARGYGQVSFVFALGTLYLQLRCAGLNISTLFWGASFLPIYVLNPGWHYRGTSGDCGTVEESDAHQMVFYIGAMLVWQIGAATWLLWRQHKSRRA